MSGPVVIYVKRGSFFAEHPEFLHPDFDLRIAAAAPPVEAKAEPVSAPVEKRPVQPLARPQIVPAPVAPTPIRPMERRASPLRHEQVWCDQCDRRVYMAEASQCSSQFCKAKALAA